MRRDYLIAILLAISAIPLGATLMVAPDYLHLGGYLVPLTFWGGITLAVTLILAAAAIAWRGEKSARNSAVSSRSNEPRNVSLLDAIWRVRLGRWGEREKERADYNEYMAARESFEKAVNDIRQTARDGKLPVWGIRRKGGAYEPIPLEFWSTHEIESGYVCNPLVEDTWVYVAEPTRIGQSKFARTQDWFDFMTSREVVEELWPARSHPTGKGP